MQKGFLKWFKKSYFKYLTEPKIIFYGTAEKTHFLETIFKGSYKAISCVPFFSECYKLQITCFLRPTKAASHC